MKCTCKPTTRVTIKMQWISFQNHSSSLIYANGECCVCFRIQNLNYLRGMQSCHVETLSRWICYCGHNSLIKGFMYCLKSQRHHQRHSACCFYHIWNLIKWAVDCSGNSLHFQVYCLCNQPHVSGSNKTHCICSLCIFFRALPVAIFK